MKIYSQNIWGNFSDKECIGNRNHLIKQLIDDINPDFLCFQECNPSTSRSGDSAIDDILKDEFCEVSKEHSRNNFTPIFYNPKNSKLIDGGYKVFEGLNDWNSKSYTWAVFKELKTDKFICIISVHFWWKYTGEVDNLQRRENAKEVALKVKEITNKYNCPVIIAGDLNSGVNSKQGSDSYNEMIKLGMNDVRYICKDSTDEYTCSYSYPKHTKDGIYYDGKVPEITIDYIFAYKKELINAKRFSIINNQTARNSSDHSPLVLELEVI